MENNLRSINRQQLIKLLRERLSWYTYQTSNSEFDVQEVEAIVRLLDILDPIEQKEYYNPEKSLERFWEYYEKRTDKAVEPAEELKAAGGTLSVSSVENSSVRLHIGKRKVGISAKHKAVTRTAVAAAVLLLVWTGGVGAYAEKDMGFFHFLNRGEDGVEFITSPQSLDDTTGKFSSVKYMDFEDVPQIYQDQIWQVESPMNEINLEYVEIVQLEYAKKIVNIYSNEKENEHLEIGVNVYDNKSFYVKNKFNEYEYVKPILNDTLEMELFRKISDDETEFAISFFDENSGKQYFVQGNLRQENIEQIMQDYMTNIL